jgi:MscS family membrane protein
MNHRRCHRALVVLFLIAALGPGRPVAQENEKAQPHQGEQENTQAEASDPLGRSTPHGTVVGFLHAAQNGKYSDATQYLQLSKNERALKGEQIAQRLQELMDEAFVGRVGTISSRREGSPAAGAQENHEIIGTFRVDDTQTDVELVRVSDARSGGIWLFSSKTLAAVPELNDQLGNDKIEARLPGFLSTRRILHTPLWRLLAFLLLIPVSYALAWGVVRLAGAATRAWLRRQHRPALKDLEKSAAAPMTLILTVLFHRAGVYFLGIALLVRVYYNRVVALLLLAGVAWLGFRLINGWAERARSRALASSRESSASVVLLGQRILKALLAVTTVLIMLSILGFDITTAVAGLGIGSIAIAFAAQKTLENLLGGISILGDQVIRVGETCRIGDKIGQVEDISLRSTTIRTLERTQLSVPNGQLANMNLENISRSDKSLLRTKLEFRLDTPPGRLSMLLEEMQRIIKDHPEVYPESVRVRFMGFEESSLEVEVFCHIRTTQLPEFLAVREDLLLRIMKLVAAAGVEFAIPSRSLYLSQDHPSLEELRTENRANTALDSPSSLETFERGTGT